MPNSIQGLNIVYPPPPRIDTSGQDILTPPPGYPDLTAQLDLWTNLSFASDEPFINTHRKERGLDALDMPDPGVDEEMQHNPPQALISHPDKPVQTNTDNNTSPITPSPITPSTQQASANDSPTSFDLGSFLAGFGIDPFLVPPQPDTDLSSASSLTKPSVTSQSPPGGPSSSVAKPGDETQPPSKRARTRKTSLPSSVASIEPDALQSASIRTRAVSELSDDHDPLSTPLTAAEDKRRRNTAASARFRAKKKEREQALERRSKELETRVNELERECEGLRRENGWLKGLVVGVTGNNTSVSNPTPAEEANSSKKRKRETDGGTLDS